MANWRDIKAKSRRAIHAHFRIPANMYRGDAPPVLVQVRLHDLIDKFHGDLVGTSANYAVMNDQNPHIISLTEEYAPDDGDVLCFAQGECYRIDNVQVPDYLTTTAEVTKLSAEKAVAYNPPSAV